MQSEQLLRYIKDIEADLARAKVYIKSAVPADVGRGKALVYSAWSLARAVIQVEAERNKTTPEQEVDAC